MRTMLQTVTETFWMNRDAWATIGKDRVEVMILMNITKKKHSKNTGMQRWVEKEQTQPWVVI